MERKNSALLLKYHNDLNQITLKGLNARESNVFFAICAIMKDHGLNELTLTFNDLKRISNITVYDESELISIIKETYQKLIRVAAYYETDTTFGGFILFDKFEGNIITKQITISVNPKFAYMINELTQNFTVMQLKEYTELQSKYTKNLYRQLQQFKKTGIYVVEVEYLRHILDIPDSYDMRKITQKIITPAIKSLSTIFKDLKVEKIREGRFIKQLRFVFKPFKIQDTFPDTQLSGVSLSGTEIKNKAVKKKSKLKSEKNQIPTLTTSKSQRVEKDKKEILCPCCNEPLSLITSGEESFYGHKNFRTSNCQMTYSSISEIEAFRNKLQNTNFISAQQDMNKDFSKQIVKLVKSNTDLFNDGGGRNGVERIVYFHKDNFTPHLVPYSEDGVKALEEYIANIRKVKSDD
jgi:plasmid replication initiation protein